MSKTSRRLYRSEKTREVSQIIRQYRDLAATVKREKGLLSDRAVVLAFTDREIPVQAGQLLLRCLDLGILGHPMPKDDPYERRRVFVFGPDQFTVRIWDLEYWRRMAKDAGTAGKSDLNRLAARHVKHLEKSRQAGNDLDFPAPFVAWVASVRKWLFPNHRERFPASLPEVFYGFVERMVPGGRPPSATSLSELQGDDAKGLRLRTRLDIHREACLLMADLLRRQRVWYYIKDSEDWRDMEQADVPPAPLTDRAAAVLDILRGLPDGRALTGTKILDRLGDKRIYIDQSTLTSSIIPRLKAYGVTNKPRVGYYISKPRGRQP